MPINVVMRNVYFTILPTSELRDSARKSMSILTRRASTCLAAAALLLIAAPVLVAQGAEASRNVFSVVKKHLNHREHREHGEQQTTWGCGGGLVSDAQRFAASVALCDHPESSRLAACRRLVEMLTRASSELRASHPAEAHNVLLALARARSSRPKGR
jgi:hypothetical protein